MRCNKCGVDNSTENKFCINCGAELKNQIGIDKSICPSCGVQNLPSNNFCIACGKPLVNGEPSNDRRALTQTNDHKKNNTNTKKNTIHQSQKSKREIANKTLGMKPLLIAIGVIAVSLLAVVALNSLFKKDVDSQYPLETKSANPLVEAEVFNIASKFVCSCGTCNEESLEVCKCGRAIEERQFIREYVERNQKKENIVFALASKYGFLKSQFAGEFKQVDKSKIFETNQITIPAINLENKKSDLDKTASVSDRVTIFSAFRCNCGKCGIDELKDCNCSHPKGAQEVKKFIDENISANKYTVQQVIELVNSKYGGKKI